MAINSWPDGTSVITSTRLWDLNPTQVQGTAVTSITLQRAICTLQNGIVSVSMFVTILEPVIGAAEMQQFELAIPITEDFSTNYDTIGSAQVTMQGNSNAWQPGIQASISSDRINNGLDLFVYIPAAAAVGSLDIAIDFRYALDG